MHYIDNSGLFDRPEPKYVTDGQKEMVKIGKTINGLAAKLADQSFLDRAPADVVEETKRELERRMEQLAFLIRK